MIIYHLNAAFTQCRLWLQFEIRQRYDTKGEKVGLLSSVMWNVLSLSERSYTDREWSGRFAKHTQQLSASRNIRETLPFFASRITIVTML